MQSILFDLDGVIYEGGDVIPGAVDAIQWFKQRDIPHLFLTNTTSVPRSGLVDKLAGFGIETHTDNFLTPAAAANRWLSHHVENKIALFVTEATVSEFDRFDITDDPEDDIDAVVIGDIGEAWDFATMNRAFRMLVNNPDAHLIALGKTRYWKGADGMQLDTGPFVVALRYATKRKPLVLGKPARKFYQAALAHLATPPEETLMIGDDIVGDIKAANKRGFHTVLVRTGKFSELDLNMGIEPNKVLDSIRDLPEYWESISHIQG